MAISPRLELPSGSSSGETPLALPPWWKAPGGVPGVAALREKNSRPISPRPCRDRTGISGGARGAEVCWILYAFLETALGAPPASHWIPKRVRGRRTDVEPGHSLNGNAHRRARGDSGDPHAADWTGQDPRRQRPLEGQAHLSTRSVDPEPSELCG